jgi:outer membrane receptor for ferrienterochelin and colicins
MKKAVVFGIGLLAWAGFKTANAQEKNADSVFNKDLDEVVVTATRSERKLGNVAVPVTIIKQKTIQQSGSVRLHDILAEQSGLFITNSFGRGIQMQGLSPDYTLILIDGEPLIGRTAGVLDLSRLSVGNIKKVEIVKGPSSGLYGSEALAGVINIITDKNKGDHLSSSLRYGRFNTIDGNVKGGFQSGKFSANAFANSYSSDGYSLLPNSSQKTVNPFVNITNQLQLSYNPSAKTFIQVNGRYNDETVKNDIAVQNNGTTVLSKGKEINKDFNLNPSFTQHFSSRFKSSLRLYTSVFESTQKLDIDDKSNTYNDFFKQEFYRIENQNDITVNDKLVITAGGGFVQEYVRSIRYDSNATKRNNSIGYFFVQNEWQALKDMTVIAGVRFDDNKAYASVWSPKIALQKKFGEKASVNFSFGRGFKAPDFRQLYLNFTNTAAGSYSVFGVLEARKEIEALQAAGQIDVLLPSYDKLGNLKPETSSGFNLGARWNLSEKINTNINFFRNDIDNLIVTDIVAYKTSGSQIYSYLNISRAFTQGIETNATWQLFKGTELSGGYQFLITADKDVLKQIKEGTVFKRDMQSGIASKLERSEYSGLPGRSKHMANLKLFYEHEKKTYFATVRALYRSRWGIADIDGNGVVNRDDEFAKGFVQVNISAGKTISEKLKIIAGADNIFNYKDPVNLPGLPGTNWYLSLTYDFLKKTHSLQKK